MHQEHGSQFKNQLENYKERLRLYKSKLEKEKSKYVNHTLPLNERQTSYNFSFRRKGQNLLLENELKSKNIEIQRLRKKLKNLN